MKCLAVTVGGVLAFDTWLVMSGRQTITSAFGAAHTNHPGLTAAATAYVLAHLYGVLPDRADVFNAAVRRAPRKKETA